MICQVYLASKIEFRRSTFQVISATGARPASAFESNSCTVHYPRCISRFALNCSKTYPKLGSRLCSRVPQSSRASQRTRVWNDNLSLSTRRSRCDSMWLGDHRCAMSRARGCSRHGCCRHNSKGVRSLSATNGNDAPARPPPRWAPARSPASFRRGRCRSIFCDHRRVGGIWRSNQQRTQATPFGLRRSSHILQQQQQSADNAPADDAGPVRALEAAIPQHNIIFRIPMFIGAAVWPSTPMRSQRCRCRSQPCWRRTSIRSSSRRSDCRGSKSSSIGTTGFIAIRAINGSDRSSASCFARRRRVERPLRMTSLPDDVASRVTRPAAIASATDCRRAPSA